MYVAGSTTLKPYTPPFFLHSEKCAALRTGRFCKSAAADGEPLEELAILALSLD